LHVFVAAQTGIWKSRKSHARPAHIAYHACLTKTCLPACLPACLRACLQYFSLAATDSQVFAWGSNAYLCLGTGNSSVIELLQPTAVAGPLGSGNRQIHGLIAGYQHAFAIADNPGDAELQKLRQQSRLAGSAGLGVDSSSMAGGLAALQHGTSVSKVAGVEVVLTEKQQLERVQLQKQQQQQVSPSVVSQGAASPTPTAAAGSSSSSSGAVAPASPSDTATTGTTSAAGRDVAAAVRATQHIAQQLASTAAAASSSSSSNCSIPGKQPPDWHTSYLPKATPNLSLPRETWSTWSPSPWHNQLAGLSPDVFVLLPKQYNPEHKNPCWGGLGPGLSCLPYFNIIGVSKCGTTDLYHRLTLYKQILAASNKVVNILVGLRLECKTLPAAAWQHRNS
jgi:N-acetylgalactosamine 4-sulfate 6-O-sulfotransferase